MVLLSYISIASASAAIITPALPLIQNLFGIKYGEVEWVMSVFLIGYVLGQVIYGPLANILGRLKALRIGLIINILGIIICLVSTMSLNFYWLLFGRLITALGASSGLACTFMLLNESVSEDRAKHALSFASVSFTVGIGGAVLIGGLITHYLNWVDCFWFLLLHGIIMLILTSCFSETLISKNKLSILDLSKSYTSALSNKRLFIFSLSVGLVSVFSYCYSASAPFIAQDLFKLSSMSYGYWNILNMIGMLAGSIFAAMAIKKYSSINILILAIGSFILSCVVLAILTATKTLNVVSFFMMSTTIYFISSFIFPTASHIASNAVDCKANASGAMNFINMGAAVLSVIILGYLPFSPLWGVIVILSLFSILCISLILIIHHQENGRFLGGGYFYK